MNFDLLYSLCNMDGASGDEDAVSKFIAENINDFSDELYKDSVGNIYALKKGFGSNKKTVMLCAHTDEVGLIISSVTDDGYLNFRTIGGIDSGVLLAKRVRIGKNKVPGVIGRKAIHLMNKDEREKRIQIRDMYIDIGVSSKEEALKIVNPGDYANFVTESEKIGNAFKAKSIDDRAGCFALIEIIKEKYYDDVWFCFTVQEEVGLRGATIAARRIKPDICIVLESTTCLDMPDTPYDKVSTRLGDGVAITIADRSTFPNVSLREELKEASPKCQFKNAYAGGNDAGTVHIRNIRTEALSVPARYIHSPVSIIDLKDLESLITTVKMYLVREEDD